MFIGDPRCDSLIYHIRMQWHPYHLRLKKRGERKICALYFSDLFVVRSSFFKLISAIALGERSVAIAWCQKVKNSNVKKCTLPITSSETLSYDI